MCLERARSNVWLSGLLRYTHPLLWNRDSAVDSADVGCYGVNPRAKWIQKRQITFVFFSFEVR